MRLYLEATERAPEGMEPNMLRLDVTDYSAAERVAILIDVRELVATWPSYTEARWHRCRHDEGGACEVDAV